MKNSCITLVNAQLYNQFKINIIKNKNICKENKRVILMTIVYTIVAIILTLYSFCFGYGLGYIGGAKVIPACALTITAVVSLILTMIKTNGVLFGYSDYEMLMSLPVKTSSIIISRFSTMYLMNVLFNLVVMIPMGAAYVIYEKPSDVFYLLWTIGILVGSLIPTTLATVIGVLIIMISSRCKNSSAVTTILSFVLVFGVAGVVSHFGSSKIANLNIENIDELSGIISKAVYKVYPIASLFARGINYNNILYFLLFVGISIGWYYLFIFLLSKGYKKLNTSIMTYKKKSNFKISSLKINTQIMALYKKELKRFFSSNIYVLNVGIGVVMLIVSTLICFFTGAQKIEELIGVNGITNILVRLLPFGMAAMLAMTCTTCVSLSLEGKNLWILQASPIKLITIFNSKILMNLTLLIPASILCSILLRICFTMDGISTLFLFVTPIVYCFFISIWGMYINIKLPNYQWKTEIAVIKQGMASMLGMIGGSLFALVPVIFVLCIRGIDYRFIEIVITSLIATFTVVLYGKISNVKRLG